jgi:menaquinone-dependent protoporphyrinogen IX oxidase
MPRQHKQQSATHKQVVIATTLAKPKKKKKKKPTNSLPKEKIYQTRSNASQLAVIGLQQEITWYVWFTHVLDQINPE